MNRNLSASFETAIYTVDDESFLVFKISAISFLAVVVILLCLTVVINQREQTTRNRSVPTVRIEPATPIVSTQMPSGGNEHRSMAENQARVFDIHR